MYKTKKNTNKESKTSNTKKNGVRKESSIQETIDRVASGRFGSELDDKEGPSARSLASPSPAKNATINI
jgi:hypothetical protein